MAGGIRQALGDTVDWASLSMSLWSIVDAGEAVGEHRRSSVEEESRDRVELSAHDELLSSREVVGDDLQSST